MNSYTGPTTVSGGTLQLGNGMSSYDGSFSGNITNNAAVVCIPAVLQTYSGNLSGTGNLTMSGTGVLILSGTGNNYTGQTVVNSGTLAASSSGAWQIASPLLPRSPSSRARPWR